MRPRPSFYRDVHKGVRACLLDLVVRAGRLDWTDGLAVTTFRGRAETAFGLLYAHAHLEDRFVTPLLERAAPEVARVLAIGHGDQEEEMAGLLSMLRAFDSAAPGAEETGQNFVLSLTRFAGHALAHMSDEEEIAMPAMWEAYDDDAILAAQGRLVANVSPANLRSFLRWMLPSMNGAERARMMEELRQAAPEPVFYQVRGLAREVLSVTQNMALERALSEVAYA